MDKRTGDGVRIPRTALVLQTHFVNPSLLKFFAALTAHCPSEYEPMLMMHVPAGTPKPELLSQVPHHFVTTPEVRLPDYIEKSRGGPEWRIWKGGHTDLCALHFYNHHKQFARYWFVEYDVRFSGAWRDFFAAFDDRPTDFISTTLRRATQNPNWLYWHTLQPPPRVRALGEEERICSFMPLFRASRQALEIMDRAYRDGWTGHVEVTWPTILAYAGASIEDIGGDGEFVAAGNRNRYYTNTPTHEDLCPGSLVFRPARWLTGRKKNRLWHPVKPFMVTFREDIRYIARAIWLNTFGTRSVPPAGSGNRAPRPDPIVAYANGDVPADRLSERESSAELADLKAPASVDRWKP